MSYTFRAESANIDQPMASVSLVFLIWFGRLLINPKMVLVAVRGKQQPALCRVTRTYKGECQLRFGVVYFHYMQYPQGWSSQTRAGLPNFGAGPKPWSRRC